MTPQNILRELWTAGIDKTTTNLIEAAMRVCDFHGDNASSREAMRLDCLAVPAHLRLDLLEHFQAAYPQPTNLNTTAKT